MGTAPDEEAYLILEQAKPWPAKIKKMEGLVEKLRRVLKAHKGEDVKLLATPEISWLEPSTEPRALLVRWDGEQAVQQLIRANPEELSSALSAPPSQEVFECYLVCTHGSRDPCCGLLGVPLLNTLSDHGSRPVLQVSHLGGHRYAPVVITFPEWRFFGRLTPEQALDMDLALKERRFFPQGYRGHGRLPKHLQVVEQKLWEEHGQSLLAVRQTGGSKERPEVEVRLRDGSLLHYRAEIERFEYVGYESCKDFRKAKKSTLHWYRVSALISTPIKV